MGNTERAFVEQALRERESQQRLSAGQAAFEAMTRTERVTFIGQLILRSQETSEPTPPSAPRTTRKKSRMQTIRAKRAASSTPSKPTRKAKKTTMRGAIARALANGARLGTGDIHAAILHYLPDAKKDSIGSEIMKMKKAHVITVDGSTERGFPAYRLVTGNERIANGSNGAAKGGSVAMS